MNDLIVVRDNDSAILAHEVSVAIAEFERQAKRIKAEEDAFKARVLAAMENLGITKIETDELTITYVAPTTQERFDTKTFKEENPDAYDVYTKIVPVKSSIRVKVKDDG